MESGIVPVALCLQAMRPDATVAMATVNKVKERAYNSARSSAAKVDVSFALRFRTQARNPFRTSKHRL